MPQYDTGNDRPSDTPIQEEPGEVDMHLHEPGYDQNDHIEVFGKFTMNLEEKKQFTLSLLQDAGITDEDLNKVALFFGIPRLEATFESAAMLEEIAQSLKEDPGDCSLNFFLLGDDPILDEAIRTQNRVQPTGLYPGLLRVLLNFKPTEWPLVLLSCPQVGDHCTAHDKITVLVASVKTANL
jgi:hypothetical protein